MCPQFFEVLLAHVDRCHATGRTHGSSEAERIKPLARADVRNPLAGFRLQRRQDVAYFLRLLASVIGDLGPAEDRNRQDCNPTGGSQPAGASHVLMPFADQHGLTTGFLSCETRQSARR